MSRYKEYYLFKYDFTAHTSILVEGEEIVPLDGPFQLYNIGNDQAQPIPRPVNKCIIL